MRGRESAPAQTRDGALVPWQRERARPGCLGREVATPPSGGRLRQKTNLGIRIPESSLHIFNSDPSNCDTRILALCRRGCTESGRAGRCRSQMAGRGCCPSCLAKEAVLPSLSLEQSPYAKKCWFVSVHALRHAVGACPSTRLQALPSAKRIHSTLFRNLRFILALS